MVTVEERYNTAIAKAESWGITVFQNYPTCCGSCAFYELGYQQSTKDYAFFVNEQGNGLEWKNGMPYHFDMQESYSGWDDDLDEEGDLPLEKYSYPATEIYFHHDGKKAARALVDGFLSQGFNVEWTGSEDKSVILHIDEWNKVIGE